MWATCLNDLFSTKLEVSVVCVHTLNCDPAVHGYSAKNCYYFLWHQVVWQNVNGKCDVCRDPPPVSAPPPEDNRSSPRVMVPQPPPPEQPEIMPPSSESALDLRQSPAVSITHSTISEYGKKIAYFFHQSKLFLLITALHDRNTCCKKLCFDVRRENCQFNLKKIFSLHHS